MQQATATVAIILLSAFGSCMCDTPANCTYDDIVGNWIFYESERNQDNNITCTNVKFDKLTHPSALKLLFPNIAFDSFGNEGTWTLIYNQGFEVVIKGRKYFAFSKYKQVGMKVTSYCHETLPGWSHDVYSRDWSCFIGQRITGPKIKESTIPSLPVSERSTYRNNDEFVKKVNERQNLWTAAVYAQFEGITFTDIVNMLGGPKSRVSRSPGSLPPTLEQIRYAKELPKEFDWRNANGMNFVSPVRNQGNCGSCYAFGSMGMMESRYRILTNNTGKPVFSTEDIVECSEYSQGCGGGFPYLIAGKYAEDFGIVLDECNPYNPVPASKCQTNPDCRRYYGTGYRYVGGFYGGCNEPLMRLALVNDGPLAVSFEVYNDFMHYKSGIYHHTGIADDSNRLNKFNPFHITNHVVVIVGYGTDTKTSTPYWIVKNSWGTSWGENGYFKILRGTDECSIESIAVEATPIPTY